MLAGGAAAAQVNGAALPLDGGAQVADVAFTACNPDRREDPSR
jgi:hypothetical protein